MNIYRYIAWYPSFVNDVSLETPTPSTAQPETSLSNPSSPNSPISPPHLPSPSHSSYYRERSNVIFKIHMFKTINCTYIPFLFFIGNLSLDSITPNVLRPYNRLYWPTE